MEGGVARSWFDSVLNVKSAKGFREEGKKLIRVQELGLKKLVQPAIPCTVDPQALWLWTASSR